MHRLVVAAVLASCGRLGFDTHRGSGDGGPRDGVTEGLGDGVTGDGSGSGSAATCPWVAGCAFPKITCCRPTGPVCVTMAACTDPVVACELDTANGCATSTDHCCHTPLLGPVQCYGLMPPC